MQKGVLKFAPMTELAKLKDDGGHPGLPPCKLEGKTWHASSPVKVSDKKKVHNPDMMFIPYWWVDSSDAEGKASMEFVTSTVDKVTFPILVNTRPLKLYEKLVYFKPKPKQEASSAAKRAKVSH